MKKLLSLLLSLLLLCTACGKLSDAPESDAKQPPPVLEESESPPLNPEQHEAPKDPEETDPRSFEERALAGEAVKITEPCAVDLDRDGTPETVDFGDWTLKPEGFFGKETWLRVSKAEIPVSVVSFGDLYLFTPDGSALMLAMQDEWYEYLYEYRDGALTEIRPIDGKALFHEWITGYNADTGCVRTVKETNIVGFVNLEYRWQDKAFQLIEQELYAYCNYDSETSPGTYLKKDFHFYANPSRKSEAVAVQRNTKLLMVGYRSDGWNKIEISDTGAQYWIDIVHGTSSSYACYDVDGTEVSIYDLFGFLGILP